MLTASALNSSEYRRRVFLVMNTSNASSMRLTGVSAPIRPVHTRLRLIDAMLEQRQGLAHLVAGQLVRVADAYAQLRVGLDQLDEPVIQCGHGAVFIAHWLPLRLWQMRRGWLTLHQRVTAFQHSVLLLVRA